MKEDTRTELTEERVREIAREEAKKVLGETGSTILGMLMGEEEARHLLQTDGQATEHLVQP